MSRLYPCAYCTEDGYCKKFSDEEAVSWCIQGPCKDERPSNGDLIRAKSDAELAIFLNAVKMDGLLRNNERPTSCFDWLDWLKQEAEE